MLHSASVNNLATLAHWPTAMRRVESWSSAIRELKCGSSSDTSAVWSMAPATSSSLPAAARRTIGVSSRHRRPNKLRSSADASASLILARSGPNSAVALTRLVNQSPVLSSRAAGMPWRCSFSADMSAITFFMARAACVAQPPNSRSV